MKRTVPFDQFAVVGKGYVCQGVFASFPQFVDVNYLFAQGVDEQFRLVDENHLHGLVAEPENDCVFRPEPPSHVHQLPLFFRTHSVLPLGLEVPAEVAE
jgi:hypothetical protein